MENGNVKKMDFKKLLVFIIIIVLLCLLVFVGVKVVGGGGVSDKEQTAIDETINDYFSKMTEGYSTVYNGADILYNKDKTTAQDLDYKSILATSIKYASKNNLDIAVSTSARDAINSSGSYGDISEYTMYNGKGVRDAAKILFGIDIDNKSILSDNDFIYNFYYVEEYDLYLMKRNNVPDLNSNLQKVEYKTIETTKKKDTYTTIVAVAYTYSKGETKVYANDKNGANVVTEAKEFPTDKIDEFTKYKVTMKLVDDHYVFESIEKVD